MEPETSAVLSTGKAGAHKIQGIGAGFVPNTLNTEVYDEIIPVSNEASFEYGKIIAKEEGVLVGISSGAALYAAIEVANFFLTAETDITQLIFSKINKVYYDSE